MKRLNCAIYTRKSSDERLEKEFNSLDAQRDACEIEIRAEAKLRRAGKGVRLIVGGGRASKPDGQMVALLRNAYATREALMSGRDATIDALAHRLGVKRDYRSAHMRLTYLAPGVVKDLFEGRQPEALTAARLASLCKDLPHDWQLQREVLGFEIR